MDTNLVVEGIKFMVLGMGSVFLFLIVMIFSMNIMSILIHKFFPEPKPAILDMENKVQDNRKVVAAITAAIAHHRQR
jgi:oxaloacetate decarboxylase gamma subunit